MVSSDTANVGSFWENLGQTTIQRGIDLAMTKEAYSQGLVSDKDGIFHVLPDQVTQEVVATESATGTSGALDLSSGIAGISWPWVAVGVVSLIVLKKVLK